FLPTSATPKCPPRVEGERPRYAPAAINTAVALARNRTSTALLRSQGETCVAQAYGDVMRDGKGKTRSKYEPGGYDLRVKRSSAGLGLFAGEDIPKGKCVIEYVGRTLSKEETYTSRSKYLFEVT